jgi:hypothetical protein
LLQRAPVYITTTTGLTTEASLEIASPYTIMAPIIGKLICNNKDAVQQRYEDTDAMIDMILRKRNDTTTETHINAEIKRKNIDISEQNNEMLKISEAIRELAEKLQNQQSRNSFSEPTDQLKIFDTDKTILQPFRNEKAQVDNLIHQNLLDAISKLQQCHDKEAFPESTPKAGNLTLLEEKTPIHSNLSRRSNGGKHAFSGFSSPNQASHVSSFTRDSGQIDESLAHLRSKLTKAKEASKINVKNNVKISSNHPLSTKNGASGCNKIELEKRDCLNSKTFDVIDQKVSRDSLFKALEASLPMQKIRSLSAGRAAQNGLHLFNRIIRGYDKANAGGAETVINLDVSPSDTTPDTVRWSGSKSSSLSDESEIFVNHHFITSQDEKEAFSKPIDLVRVSDKRQGFTQRSATPTPRARSGSRSKSRHNPVNLLHNNETHSHRMKNKSNALATVGSTIDFSSPKSAFLSPQQNRQPVKYKPIRNESEKGYEIFLTDAPKVSQMKNRDTNGQYSSSRSDTTIHREEMKHRLKSHRRAIERLQQELYASNGISHDNKTNLQTPKSATGASVYAANMNHQHIGVPVSFSKASSEKRKPTRSIIRE